MQKPVLIRVRKTKVELQPHEQPPLEKISEWYNVARQLAKLKQQEHFMRVAVFNGFFPEPKEGTNNFPLPDDFVLKGKYNINRNVDKAALTALTPNMREEGVNVDELFEWKPELKKSIYNKLTDEQRNLVDQVLKIKPGSPGLEVALTAAGKRKLQEAAEQSSNEGATEPSVT